MSDIGPGVTMIYDRLPRYDVCRSHRQTVSAMCMDTHMMRTRKARESPVVSRPEVAGYVGWATCEWTSADTTVYGSERETLLIWGGQPWPQCCSIYWGRSR
jgi:hypothetical protein